MPEGTYVNERQVEYWTSREIEGFFLDSGFEVTVLPITQLTERAVPADFMFLDGHTNKLFGLQYKALYHNGEDFWNLDERQHSTLQGFDWIYYGLSDLRSGRQHRNALHYLRVVGSGFPFSPRLTRRDFQQSGFSRYLRWAAFFEGLCDCRFGRRITSSLDLQHAIWPQVESMPREIGEIVTDVFLTDLEGRRTTRFSSLLRDRQQ